MAKPRKPLLGYGAAGSLGQTLTFQRYRRLSIARQKPTPTDPQSNAQLSQRSAFAQCTFYWTLLTPAQQDTYRQLRYPPHLTGHQRYVRLCLEGKVPPPPGPFVNLWLPDAPPPVPSPYDDEFDDANLDLTKWTLWDPAANHTIQENEHGLAIAQAQSPVGPWGGIFQPIPPGDFTIYTRLALHSVFASSPRAALILGQDLAANPNTSDIIALCLAFSEGGGFLACERYNDYQTYNTTYRAQGSSFTPTFFYLALRLFGNLLTPLFSLDGLGWEDWGAIELPWWPKEAGLAFGDTTNWRPTKALFSFFRYSPDSTLQRIMEGDRLVVGWPT